MIRFLVPAALLVAALIHLVPLVGVLGVAQLQSLYGIDASTPDLAILMRHRAVLFGLLGGFLVLAAFRKSLQPLAFVAAFASVVSFIALAWATGGYGPELARVVKADLVVLAVLVVGTVALAVQRRAPA
jgi:hypothetical protein